MISFNIDVLPDEDDPKKESSPDYENSSMFDDEEVDKYSTYEEYLDSLVSEEDHRYLEDEDMARIIAELGYRSSGDTLSREGFNKLKFQLAESRNLILRKKNGGAIEVAEKETSSENETPFIKALKTRAPLIQSGKLLSIIFMRTINTKKSKCGDHEYKIEISGHIDLADRQLSENWIPYLTGEKQLIPRSSGLTYYHWNRGTGVFNSTDNFEVVARLPVAHVIHRRTGRKINITDTTQENGWISIPDEQSKISIYDLDLETQPSPN